MKELISQSRNIMAVPEAKGMQSMVELIITVSEPRLTFDEAGGAVMSRTLESFRFSTTPEGLRAHAKYCLEAADDTEKQIRKACEREAKRHGSGEKTAPVPEMKVVVE